MGDGISVRECGDKRDKLREDFQAGDRILHGRIDKVQFWIMTNTALTALTFLGIIVTLFVKAGGY